MVLLDHLCVLYLFRYSSWQFGCALEVVHTHSGFLVCSGTHLGMYSFIVACDYFGGNLGPCSLCMFSYRGFVWILIHRASAVIVQITVFSHIWGCFLLSLSCFWFVFKREKCTLYAVHCVVYQWNGLCMNCTFCGFHMFMMEGENFAAFIFVLYRWVHTSHGMVAGELLLWRGVLQGEISVVDHYQYACLSSDVNKKKKKMAGLVNRAVGLVLLEVSGSFLCRICQNMFVLCESFR